ncbi:SWI2/SNF2-containing protein [Cardiosporidium cionae]|uniref:SWI2/SNF2-containing protein n=1 Tax=Cardiosporidium cionae TaxID=476202 RepID=A0ABQ7JB39_9APIC|nr:SWI2/SNF2-containing protein [Cardiosporidium cionae]|eukprot:KAF8821191.1 SWI2/SNF2-containing protein [Cardiosporidium cionae]
MSYTAGQIRLHFSVRSLYAFISPSRTSLSVGGFGLRGMELPLRVELSSVPSLNGDTPAVFAFGKHRSKTFHEVAVQHPDYAQWACRIPNPTGQLREFVLFVKSQHPCLFTKSQSDERNNSNQEAVLPDRVATPPHERNFPPYVSMASEIVSNPSQPLCHLQASSTTETSIASHTVSTKLPPLRPNPSCTLAPEELAYVASLQPFSPWDPSAPISHTPVEMPHLPQTSFCSPSILPNCLQGEANLGFSQALYPSASSGYSQSPSMRPSTAIPPLPITEKNAYPPTNVAFVDLDSYSYTAQPHGDTPTSLRGYSSSSTSCMTSPLRGSEENAMPKRPREVSSLPTAIAQKRHHFMPKESEVKLRLPLEQNLALELISPTTFKVISQKKSIRSQLAQKWLSILPSSVWKILKDLSPLPKTSNSGMAPITFSSDKYENILQILREHFLYLYFFSLLQNFECELQSIPNFVLRCFPCFLKAASPLALPRKTANILMRESSPQTLERKSLFHRYIGRELEQQLKPFQLEGIEFGLSRNGRVLIGDEMGLGKTLQSLAIAAYYCDDWPLLVVCPSSIRFQWRDQAIRWLPHHLKPQDICVVTSGKTQIPSKIKMVIISYDLISSNSKFQQAYQTIICDESHYLKNIQAKRTQVLTPIVRHSRRAILLSGTPALNKPIELYQQIAVLLPDFGSYQEFAARYCEQQLNWFTKRMEFVGHKHVDELHLFLKNTIMIRRLKKDVQKELPPKLRSRVPIEVPEKEMREIRDKMKFLNSVDEGFSEKFQLKEGPPEPLKSGNKGSQQLISELFTLTGRAKIKGATDYISYLIQADCKFLVFAHHKEMLDALEKQTQKEKITYIRIDGSTDMAKREVYVKKFQSEAQCKVALLSITACGQGLNLTAAGIVVFAELYWVPGQMIQAEDRSHRIGTDFASVDIHYLIAEKTLDENVWKTLTRKWGVMTSTLDGAAEALSAQQVERGSMGVFSLSSSPLENSL